MRRLWPPCRLRCRKSSATCPARVHRRCRRRPMSRWARLPRSRSRSAPTRSAARMASGAWWSRPTCDRDLGSFVEELREQVAREVELPPGYWVDYGGTFEQLISASDRLMVVVPVVLIMIFGRSEEHTS